MIAGMVVMLGCVGLTGGFMWLKNERANRPDRIWYAIKLEPHLSHEQHQEFADKVREQLATDEILGKISREMNLRERGGFPTEEAAVIDLRARLICEVGEFNYKPSLDVGFRGKSRENAMLRELTGRLMEDLQVILNMSAPYDSP